MVSFTPSKGKTTKGPAKASETPSKTKGKASSKPEVRPLSVIGGYMVLPVRTALAGDGQVHQLYVRKHQAKAGGDAAADSSVLFVTNLTPYCSAAALERLFPGAIETTFGVLGDAARDLERASTLSPLPSLAARTLFPEVSEPTSQHRRTDGAVIRPRGSFALVRMPSTNDVNTVLAWREAERELVEDEADANAVDRFMEEYIAERPEAEELRQRADAYMARYDSRLEQERMSLRSRASQPDEDGFTLVTRQKSTDSGVGVIGKRAMDALKGKSKASVLPDFYRFQMRQAKREQLADLRRKFEDDKLRVEKMKANRKFRPY